MTHSPASKKSLAGQRGKAMREITLARDSQTCLPFTSQVFSVTNVNQKRLGFHFKYSTMLNRWTFDLTVDGEVKLCGRTVVMQTNLFAPHGLSVGSLFAIDVSDRGAEPGLKELIDGSVRLVLLEEGERIGIEVQRQARG